MTMPQVGVDGRDSYGESVNHKLDHMVGNREHGQLVQIDRANAPLPVKGVGNNFKTPFVTLPGVAVAAHANGDALGTKFVVTVPSSGTLQAAILPDMAKQSLQVDFILFTADFTGGTDDAAFDMADADRVNLAGFISVSSFADFNDSSVGLTRSWGLDYVAPLGMFYVQAVARGAITPAAVDDFSVSFIINSNDG